MRNYEQELENRVAFIRQLLKESGCEGIRTHRIGTDRDIKLHGLMTRTLDLNGFCSTKATKEFVQWIREYDPDVIWLHNIHGY